MPNDKTARGVANDHSIELRTDDVEGLFHPFDPSPLSERTLASAADEFVVGRVSDLPEDAELSLRILLPASEASCCADVQEAFRAHYAASAARQRRALRRHFRDAGFMLLKGVIFAVILITIAKLIASISDSLVLDKIASGLSLIVWVSLWRPVDMLIYEWRPIKNEVLFRDRLAGINVQCVTFA